MTATGSTLHRMHAVSPEGRREALWVERVSVDSYRLLSVPVWVYGLSRGTLVACRPSDGDDLVFARVLRESPGATVRFIVPEDRKASAVYLSEVLPRAGAEGMFVGPATFFNPRLVAMNIHTRADWWPTVGTFLDALVEQGVLEQWEVADPDEYASEHATEVRVEVANTILAHPFPVDIGQNQSVS